MSQPLHTIFENRSESERAKFLSRVFGIFSEQIVSLWALNERAPYRDLGRPTIRTNGGSQGFTLDFALQDRITGKVYVAEMKCEIEYQGFRYFVLKNGSQLDHHRKPAFEAFLKAAHPTIDQTISIRGQNITSDGAILIWGAATPEGREHTIQSRGFHEVLSVDEICRDLAAWKCTRYSALIEQRRKWCGDLFDGLLSVQTDSATVSVS